MNAGACPAGGAIKPACRRAPSATARREHRIRGAHAGRKPSTCRGVLRPRDWPARAGVNRIEAPHRFSGRGLSTMKTYTVAVQRDLDASIVSLRSECYPVEHLDRFDRVSSHLTVREEGALAATGRLTPGPDGVFHDWTRGKAETPGGDDAVDLSRCMVAPDHRGRGLFQLIGLAALLHAKHRGFRYVNGGVVSGHTWIAMLERIGLRRSGPLVQGQVDIIQPLSCDLRDPTVCAERDVQDLAGQLRGRGVSLVGEVPGFPRLRF